MKKLKFKEASESGGICFGVRNCKGLARSDICLLLRTEADVIWGLRSKVNRSNCKLTKRPGSRSHCRSESIERKLQLDLNACQL